MLAYNLYLLSDFSKACLAPIPHYKILYRLYMSVQQSFPRIDSSQKVNYCKRPLQQIIAYAVSSYICLFR